MSDQTYSNLIDDLDWGFFVAAVNEVSGADGWGMYCMGNEL